MNEATNKVYVHAITDGERVRLIRELHEYREYELVDIPEKGAEGVIVCDIHGKHLGGADYYMVLFDNDPYIKPVLKDALEKIGGAET